MLVRLFLRRSVLVGDGTGSFAEVVTYAVGERPEKVMITHLNKDRFADVLALNNDSTVSVLAGREDGGLSDQVSHPTGGGGMLGIWQPEISTATVKLISS